ncbi:hypothetical protein ACLB2K_031968 [Fragaria x ananassa]
MGHIQKAGNGSPPESRHLQEFRLQNIGRFEPNQKLDFNEIFKEGDLIDVAGTTIGKCFQGGIKKHHFKEGQMTHVLPSFLFFGPLQIRPVLNGDKLKRVSFLCKTPQIKKFEEKSGFLSDLLVLFGCKIGGLRTMSLPAFDLYVVAFYSYVVAFDYTSLPSVYKSLPSVYKSLPSGYRLLPSIVAFDSYDVAFDSYIVAFDSYVVAFDSYVVAFSWSNQSLVFLNCPDEISDWWVEDDGSILKNDSFKRRERRALKDWYSLFCCGSGTIFKA